MSKPEQQCASPGNACHATPRRSPRHAANGKAAPTGPPRPGPGEARRRHRQRAPRQPSLLCEPRLLTTRDTFTNCAGIRRLPAFHRRLTPREPGASHTRTFAAGLRLDSSPSRPPRGFLRAGRMRGVTRSPPLPRPATRAVETRAAGRRFVRRSVKTIAPAPHAGVPRLPSRGLVGCFRLIQGILQDLFTRTFPVFIPAKGSDNGIQAVSGPVATVY